MENDRIQFNDDGKECIHHWLIDERNSGVCKKCGVSKQFFQFVGQHPKIMVRRSQQGASCCSGHQELTYSVV